MNPRKQMYFFFPSNPSDKVNSVILCGRLLVIPGRDVFLKNLVYFFWEFVGRFEIVQLEQRAHLILY